MTQNEGIRAAVSSFPAVLMPFYNLLICIILIRIVLIRISSFGFHQLRTVSCLGERGHDGVLVVGAVSLQCDAQFHSRISVDADELVVFQTDYIALSLWIRPCCTMEAMVITSMLPPLRMETIFLFSTFICFKAATVRRPEFSTIIL